MAQEMYADQISSPMDYGYAAASFRRMFGDRWNKMTEEERRKAMSDPYSQGLLQGQQNREEMRRVGERTRGFKVGTQGTGFDR